MDEMGLVGCDLGGTVCVYNCYKLLILGKRKR